jgi:hypothetical protein
MTIVIDARSILILFGIFVGAAMLILALVHAANEHARQRRLPPRDRRADTR